EILESTKNRINSMATVHKKIYQSNDNVHINLKEYIEEEVQNISKRNKKPNINLDFNLDDVKVGIDKAIPLSLIISGIINNSFAYAFPSNEKGNIKISLEKNSKGLIKLLIADNGIGLPSNVNIENPKDVGIILIKSLTEQIEGSIELLP
ncbi:sensor histidine kinase, partial [Methanobrevibacter sp. UBA313]